MRATELIPGDWVFSEFSDKPQIVTFIQVVNDYGWVKTTGVEGTKSEFSLSPIPLTQEILDKWGLKKKDECAYWITDNVYWDAETIYLVNEWTKTKNHDIVILPCRYVHQLQHILWIYGINKKVKL